MRTAVIGAGPTGLYSAIALARRGHEVVLVDRDAGPGTDGEWNRTGVAQFHHPHGFRQPVVDALRAEMPEVLDALFTAGAEPASVPAQGGQPQRLVGINCRRVVFERVLRAAAAAEPGVTLRTGHVEDVIVERGCATGVRVGGSRVDADLVLAASGRAGQLARGLRRPGEGGDCGIAYASRQYQLLPGAEHGPTNSPIGMAVSYPGYAAIVFLHDNRTFSTLIARASADSELAALGDPGAFEAASGAIPALAAWTDPQRSRPLSPVLPGLRLHNTYRSQLDDTGGVPAAGLVFVGDAVCTTNPTAGRGVSTSLMQAHRLVGLLDEHRHDDTACTAAFEAWCVAFIKPWFDDHVATDAGRVRRWSGHDIDLTQHPLPSDLVMSAAAVDPSMMRVVGPYLSMLTLPTSLAAVEPRAREIYTGGWRPPVPDGPSRDELAELVTAAGPAAVVP